MSDITKIDPNFNVETSISEEGIRFYDIKQHPFKIYGVFFEGDRFRRMPEEVAKAVSEGVYELHANTAGGRVRFKTDSPYVAINTKMLSMCRLQHCAPSGTAGFDMYVCDDGEKYAGTFIPHYSSKTGFESIVYFKEVKMREITINFPLYSNVSEVNVGLKEGSNISEPTPYKITNPIVYYGSSVTQGGCASRPGNSYQGIVSRRFNADYINLGFSGSAKGEPEITDYIKNLNMSVFVYDYDYNAPTLEHLANTHEKMFLAIREKQPDLPIVIMSRPKYYLNDDEKLRFEVIKKTYDNAKAMGDKNVYLVDGKMLMSLAEDNGTVDGCHPNDLGFMSMANAVTDVLNKIIL